VQGDEAGVAARMLEKTTNKSQQREEEGFCWRLKMFDPAVPGFIFWPIILGWCFLLASLALSIR
jgi:hypothetical protein